MTLIIREEKESDYKDVFNLIENAFSDEKYSNHCEQFLVEKLRNSETFIPELSLIAEFNKQIVGHILLTKIRIISSENTFESLALAPLSVLKSSQGKGIGTILIKEAHIRAKKLNYKSIIVLGHKDYYSKFGYKATYLFNIKLPFDVPKDNCMLIELEQKSLDNISGIVEYPKVFFD